MIPDDAPCRSEIYMTAEIKEKFSLFVKTIREILPRKYQEPMSNTENSVTTIVAID